MKLYGSYTSPFVRHPRILLLETGLECEFIETDAAASAVKSPTKKVPFLEDGDLFLSDSCSIVKHLREKSGQTFCNSALEFDQLCAVNTLMDAAVNLFMLEKDGITPAQSAYLKRHAARIESGLAELNNQSLSMQAPYTDAELRLGCFLAWVNFRQRFSFAHFENLSAFLAKLESYPPFAATAPVAN